LLLVAAFSLGVGTTAVQMLIPLAAHMTDDASRGRVVGKITGGLLAGIMLARPVASVAENVVGCRHSCRAHVSSQSPASSQATGRKARLQGVDRIFTFANANAPSPTATLGGPGMPIRGI
jgi:hypothetical protein